MEMENQTTNPCDSCAFSPGAGAHDEIYNRFRAEVCALTGVPFYCHHGFDWENQPRYLAKSEVRQIVLCAGWKREVQRHVKPGIAGKRARLVRRWKGLMVLERLEQAVNLTGKAKALAWARLQKAVLSLHAEDGFTQIVRKKLRRKTQESANGR
jgi:hypothetical protein